MQSIRSRSIAASVALAALAAASACHDSGTDPIRASSIEILSGNDQAGAVGQKLAVAPTFLVKDEKGQPLSGVGLSISITAGNGSVANAPRRSAGGPTSAGIWTLGLKSGANQLTVKVNGLPPLVFNATAIAGAATKFSPAVPTTFSARVGDLASPSPVAKVTDAYGNAVAGAIVRVSVAGGGTAPQSVAADENGNVTIPDWKIGEKVGQDVLTLNAGNATLSFIANKFPSDPATVIVVSGGGQLGTAGAPLATPIRVRVADRFENPLAAQSAVFSVTSGGGAIEHTTATADADGAITVPSWTLGKTSLPQTVHVTSGQAAGDVSVNVQTDFKVDVRFFGPEMTDAQKALFINAAARLSAIITGDIADAPAVNLDVASACGLPGLPVLNETIDDVIIYASIQEIDGPSKILAQAGPCAFRGREAGFLATIGVMEFDAADIDRIGANGTLQDVITHEMLHVLGIGTLWSAQRLMQGERTPGSTYLGLAGRQGCVGAGGVSTCATGVPVENNGVPGTADSHWRESVFQSELMTGYVNAGPMPLSAITVGSLQDLGYTVNMLATDPFQIPTSPPATNAIPGEQGWERPLPGPGVILSPSGVATKIKRP